MTPYFIFMRIVRLCLFTPVFFVFFSISFVISSAYNSILWGWKTAKEDTVYIKKEFGDN